MSDTTLRLYDTLTKTKVPLVPAIPGKVRMYVCGPTVYDYAHIGNARPVIVFDVLFRLLRHIYGPDDVTYARNITDVDDKINARAARDYPGLPLNEAIAKVTAATEAQFKADAAALGCLEPTHEPRATEHIDQMRAIIERLVQRGVAYVAEGHVLFSPVQMEERQGRPKYGSLARRSLDEMLAGARVDVAPYKRDPMDFVLWKPSTEGEPGWPSPCGIDGLGRPGWHIECSAMSMAKLLEPFGGGLACEDPSRNVFDIHGGGIDLVFPHHENEIAQSCCAFGAEKMANIWMHNGFLQVEGEKMSKSLGNFVTIHELLQDWPGHVLRFNMLKTHYRQPINWTLSSLKESETELETWANALLSTVGQQRRIRLNAGNVAPQPSPEVEKALIDDLNTPKAIAALRSHLADLRNGNEQASVSLADSAQFLGLLDVDRLPLHSSSLWVRDGARVTPPDAEPLFRKARVSFVNRNLPSLEETQNALAGLGLKFVINDETGAQHVEFLTEDIFGSKINSLINARLEARREKNFAESDRIRDELVAMGIQIMDAKDPVTGELTTTWQVKR